MNSWCSGRRSALRYAQASLVELADRPPDLEQGRVRRQRRAERDGHRQRDPLGQPAGLHRAEDAGRGAVEVDGDDRHRPPLDDPLQPALERLKSVPVRVICPSGKMQTSSPSSSALPASRNAWRIIFGPPLPAIGIARIARRNGPRSGRSEVLGVDDEPDRPVDRGDQEQAVGERDVVGRQQRRPFAGHVRRPITRTR